jgi:hypothetical protein
MPLRLLHLTTCERAITDTAGGFSAIAMFESIAIDVPAETPSKFLYPMKWSAVAVWGYVPDTDTTSLDYTQKTIVVSPEGEAVFTAETPFTVDPKKHAYRNIISFDGFPISVTGIMTVQVFLKSSGIKEWEYYASLPIQVERNLQEAVNDN